MALIVAAVAALAVAAARTDFRPSLAHLHVRILSGPVLGNYSVLVDRVVVAAREQGGAIENLASLGSADNMERLVAAARSCDVQAAVVQSGTPVPAGARVEVIARLAKAESLILLGKHADDIKDFAQLAHLRIGVGPEHSGTSTLVRQIFESRDFKPLAVTLTNASLDRQIELAAKGELDLAAFVIDEDAEIIQRAVRDHGLGVVGFPHADVVARQFRFLRKGRIGAGEYDAVRMLPPTDKDVLRVDTLIVGNGCARRSQVMALATAFAEAFPELTRHNKETPNTSGLPLDPAAKAYWETGPEALDQYLPRVSDVMPTSNWLHLVMALSVLFNAIGLANRFALWRIDAARVKAEEHIARCFGHGVTLGDIARITPAGELAREGLGEEVGRVIVDLEALAARSRRLSLSPLVPMGGEMAYRYQEGLIHDRLAVLRAFRERWELAQR